MNEGCLWHIGAVGGLCFLWRIAEKSDILVIIQTGENTAAIAKISDEMLRRSDLLKIFKILRHWMQEKNQNIRIQQS